MQSNRIHFLHNNNNNNVDWRTAFMANQRRLVTVFMQSKRIHFLHNNSNNNNVDWKTAFMANQRRLVAFIPKSLNSHGREIVSMVGMFMILSITLNNLIARMRKTKVISLG
jgi:hypothetical protein